MAFTKLTKTQNKFLEEHLRGTGRAISARQAEALYGIKNIRARMSEFRSVGLNVRTEKNTEGRTTYAVSRRDIVGDQYKIFA